MNLDKIKNLVKQNGDKFIFVENGEPEIVMMSFREYEKLAASDINLRMHTNYTNSEISYRSGLSDLGPEELKETEIITPFAAESPGLPVRLEDIRLEDLPI